MLNSLVSILKLSKMESKTQKKQPKMDRKKPKKLLKRWLLILMKKIRQP
jgi:hypothetical protein